MCALSRAPLAVVAQGAFSCACAFKARQFMIPPHNVVCIASEIEGASVWPKRHTPSSTIVTHLLTRRFGTFLLSPSAVSGQSRT